MKVKDLILHIFHGFCMALADSVPGVSGGTVAFLMGFYDNFIRSLNDLLMGGLAAKKKALLYLIKLGAGWAIGFVASVLVLTSVFESHIYNISSLFLGFILFAIPVVIYEERSCLKEKLWTVFMVLIGAAGVAALTYFTISSGENDAMTLESLQLSNLTFGRGLYVFIAGAIAICAMVLPGISGSTLLLIFGLYIAIISAVKELLTLHFEYLPILIIFGLGVITGICSIVRLIRIALEKWRSATVFLIIGMMLGSLYSVIMGPATLDVPQDPMTFSSFNIFFFLIGGAIIVGMQLMGMAKKKNNEKAA